MCNCPEHWILFDFLFFIFVWFIHPHGVCDYSVGNLQLYENVWIYSTKRILLDEYFTLTTGTVTCIFIWKRICTFFPIVEVFPSWCWFMAMVSFSALRLSCFFYCISQLDALLSSRLFSIEFFSLFGKLMSLLPK